MVRQRRDWESLDTHRKGFQQQFAGGEDILRFLDASYLQLTRVELDPIDQRSWQLFVKPNARLTDMFGYDREILVYCSPFTEFQSRTVEAIEGRLRRDPLRLDGDVAILISSDGKIADKVQRFRSRQRVTIIPFSLRELARPKTEPGFILMRRMGNFLYSRNLYDETTPVDGARFFGRTREVDFCVDALLNGDQLGVFGVRKIGKTSVVREVKDRLESRPVVSFPRVSYVDIQLHALTRSCDELLFRIGSDFFGSGKTTVRNWPVTWRQHYSQDYASLPKGATTARFADDIARMAKLMAGLGPHRRSRLILIIDEVESLVGTQIHRGFDDGVDFMKMWRGLCQQFSFISTAIVGVNSTMIDLPVFQGVDNPMFKFFKPFYLPNFSFDETEKMVKTLGHKIGISYRPKCSEWLHDQLGGHPFLTRQFCATVAQEHPKRPVGISIADLENASTLFLRRHSNVFEQVFEILDQFYPDEAIVMEMVAAGEVDDPYQICESPDEIDHLVGCGLLSVEPGQTSIPIGLLASWIRENRLRT